MKWNNANQIARKMEALLGPYCDKIAVAGSVRRGKPECHDIEIVAVPHCEMIAGDLFGTPHPVYPIQAFIADGIKSGDWQRIKGGEKYVQLELPEGINLDLFLVTPPAQWGVIYTLRTGPKEFSHWIASHRSQGGCLPSYAKMENGCIYEGGRALPMPEEQSFFNYVGLPIIEPELRQACWGKVPVRDYAIGQPCYPR
jgi:DNA polymerase/3'-5' exonuclease PolX